MGKKVREILSTQSRNGTKVREILDSGARHGEEGPGNPGIQAQRGRSGKFRAVPDIELSLVSQSLQPALQVLPLQGPSSSGCWRTKLVQILVGGSSRYRSHPQSAGIFFFLFC